MRSVAVTFIVFLLSAFQKVMACPGCADVVGNIRESYVPYVVMTFIFLVYIPYYFIFRVIMKNRNVNAIPPEKNADTY